MFPQSTSIATFDAGLVELTNGNNTLQISGGWNYYEIDRADLIFTNAPPPAFLPRSGELNPPGINCLVATSDLFSLRHRTCALLI
jgi:hypothetical protein